MSEAEGEGPAGAGSAKAAASSKAAAGAQAAAGEGRVRHDRSFKLRFAAQREPGRSDVSAVKPLGMPATVTDKFYRRRAADGPATERSLRRIRELFARGPRETYAAPRTASHEYGWWWDRAAKMATTTFSDRRLHHHIQDSAWLKARLLVLAADDKLKQK